MYVYVPSVRNLIGGSYTFRSKDPWTDVHSSEDMRLPIYIYIYSF